MFLRWKFNESPESPADGQLHFWPPRRGEGVGERLYSSRNIRMQSITSTRWDGEDFEDTKGRYKSLAGT